MSKRRFCLPLRRRISIGFLIGLRMLRCLDDMLSSHFHFIALESKAFISLTIDIYASENIAPFEEHLHVRYINATPQKDSEACRSLLSRTLLSLLARCVRY